MKIYSSTNLGIGTGNGWILIMLRDDQNFLVIDGRKMGHQWHLEFLACVTTLVPSTELENTKFVRSGSCVWFWS